MTTNDPMTPSADDLLALEAQVLRLADPKQVSALDQALKAEPAPATVVEASALLADLRLVALLDGALAAEAAPAGLADRILAAAPLEQAAVAGKIAPAVKGRVGGEWMRKPWRYAAVASVSFSLSLMAVTFIVKNEAPMLGRAFGMQDSAVSSDVAKLQMVVLASGTGDEALMEEMEETGAELELAGL